MDGHLSGGQGRPVHKDELIHSAIQPVGRAALLRGRFVVFPNTHAWKMSALPPDENKVTEATDRKMTWIRMELVNPEKRILSTREVVNTATSRDEVETRRQQLKELRMMTSLDVNARPMDLYTD